MIERGHLAILRALAEAGNLARAAVQLHLTQSALTHAIRKLEKQVGVTLWEKQGRGVRLTQAGEYLLQESRRLLPQLEAIDATLQAYAAGRKGKLRIGMECHPCYEWLMNRMPDYLARWPSVDVDVVQAFRFDGLGGLNSRQIDVLISSDPLDQPDLAHQPVLDYELQLVVPLTHPYSQVKYVKATALRGENLITFPVERARLDIFSQFLDPAGVLPARQQTVETIEIMLQLVASGRGVCALPDWLVAKYRQANYPVQGVRLGAVGVFKQLLLIYRRESAVLDYLEDFVASA